MSKNELLNTLSKELKSLQKVKKIAIAVSGGIDSLALVFLVKEWIKSKSPNIELVALTVDHKLRPTSTEEAEYVHDLMNKNDIEHHILTWDSLKNQSNIEFHARNARYELMTSFCKQEGIENLLIAHHLQDQAETFMIRLFRGSGIDGLSAIQNESEVNGIKLIRPLLNIKKQDLTEYLVQNKIEWVEDESNEDEKYLRNKIRKFLDSLDEKDLIVNRISNTVNEISKARKIIENDLLNRASEMVEISDLSFVKLNLKKFQKLDKDLGLRLLAWIFMDVSGNEYKPRLEKLKRFYNKIVQERGINKKQTFYGCCFYLHETGRLIFYREVSKVRSGLKNIGNNEYLWDGRFIVKNIDDSFEINNITPQALNGLIRSKKINERIVKRFDIPKEIFYTIPVVRVLEKIVQIPHIKYIDDDLQNGVKVSYLLKTPLKKIVNLDNN